jgi:hypothetical protein
MVRYYTAFIEDEPTGQSTTRPLYDFIANNGYILVTKPVMYYGGDGKKAIMKGNLDV